MKSWTELSDDLWVHAATQVVVIGFWSLLRRIKLDFFVVGRKTSLPGRIKLDIKESDGHMRTITRFAVWQPVDRAAIAEALGYMSLHVGGLLVPTPTPPIVLSVAGGSDRYRLLRPDHAETLQTFSLALGVMMSKSAIPRPKLEDPYATDVLETVQRRLAGLIAGANEEREEVLGSLFGR